MPVNVLRCSSGLAVIGALAMFPLMSLDNQFQMAEGLPGAIATMLLIMFVIPVWPVHRRLLILRVNSDPENAGIVFQ